MIKVNIINEYNSEDYNKLFKKIVFRASIELKVFKKRILNVLITDNDTIKSYNLKFRNKDIETDVLSFPSDENGELGDIIISFPKALEQAHDYGHSLDRELGFLLIHGTLHCLGYDHMNKDEEEIMFSLQEKILNKVNLRRV